VNRYQPISTTDSTSRDRFPENKKAPVFRGLSDSVVELMGIEPTASRVRWQGEDRVPKDFANLERQETSESVPERPILATCSQNPKGADPVAEQLAKAEQGWKQDRDPRELRKALFAIMELLGE
jgi:hypothetical protein